MNKETMIAIPADPNDPEDRDISVASLERGLLARPLRMLRTRPGLTTEDFAARYAMPTEDMRGTSRASSAPLRR